MATQAAQDTGFHDRMRRLEKLLQDVDAIPDQVTRDKTGQIIQSLMEFHGEGFRTILRHLTDAGEAGQAILDTLAMDDVVGSLLLLYDLHPLGLDARVQLALDQVRPSLASHGVGVRLVRITADNAVHLRMEGGCHGCRSSTANLRETIEQAILGRAPDATAIHLEEDADSAANGFVPVEHLTHRQDKKQSNTGANKHVVQS